MTAPSEPPGETACEACRGFIPPVGCVIAVPLDNIFDTHHALLSDLRQRLERAEAVIRRLVAIQDEVQGTGPDVPDGEFEAAWSEARRALSEVRK